MWQSEALVSAVLAAAAGAQPEEVRRAALWLVWNLSLDHPTNRRLSLMCSSCWVEMRVPDPDGTSRSTHSCQGGGGGGSQRAYSAY